MGVQAAFVTNQRTYANIKSYSHLGQFYLTPHSNVEFDEVAAERMQYFVSGVFIALHVQATWGRPVCHIAHRGLDSNNCLQTVA